MDFKYGDILLATVPYYGAALFMVVNPPVVCESCGEVIRVWDYEEDGTVKCPFCGYSNVDPPVLKDRFGNEMMSLAVAANSDTGTDSPNWTPIYNFLVNKVYSYSVKSVEDDVRNGRLHLCSDEEAFNRKCMIVWTNTEGYGPGLPVPEWIKELIKES